VNDLEQYFEANTGGRLIYKWRHYFEIYESHFARFRNREVVVLEIGVFQGGSLQMWKKYFGPNAQIYGVDINPICKTLEEPQIKILIGDQSDPVFLRSLIAEIPKVDIIIDDGGHAMDQQINSFEVLYPHLNTNGGVYLVEDTHSSYAWDSGGGWRRRGTFIEYSKWFVDYLHAWSLPAGRRTPKMMDFAHSTKSVTFYNGVVVLHKERQETPSTKQTGKPNPAIELVSKDLPSRLKKLIRLVMNYLRYKPFHRG